MIKPKQIPDVVVEEFIAEWREDHDHKAAIAAALNAWPWMTVERGLKLPSIVLPLPQKEPRT